jgi:hypothetical protein
MDSSGQVLSRARRPQSLRLKSPGQSAPDTKAAKISVNNNSLSSAALTTNTNATASNKNTAFFSSCNCLCHSMGCSNATNPLHASPIISNFNSLPRCKEKSEAMNNSNKLPTAGCGVMICAKTKPVIVKLSNSLIALAESNGNVHANHSYINHYSASQRINGRVQTVTVLPSSRICADNVAQLSMS